MVPSPSPKRKEMPYLRLRRQLERLVKEGQPGAALPSYLEIRRRYGVAQSTIDRVFAEFDALGLIVRQAGKGIFVSPTAGRPTLGFVVGFDLFAHHHSPICSMLLQQCRARAARQRMNCKFYLNRSIAAGAGEGVLFHRELAQDLAAGRLDGVILVWSSGPEEVEWLRSHRVPMVSFGAGPGTGARVVDIDYRALVRRGAAALAEAGCRRIALLTPDPVEGGGERESDVEVFRAALKKHGLAFDPGLVIQDEENRLLNYGGKMGNEELGFDLMSRFLRDARKASPGGKGPLPLDGLLCKDDMFTRGALSALHRQSIGDEDIRIATHSNKGSPALKNYEDKLILLEIDPAEIVDQLFRILEGEMKGGKEPARGVLVAPRLVIARSVARKRKSPSGGRTAVAS